MKLGNALIVYRKELRDMLRDKRTIRSMVIVPVVVFPLLFLGIGYIQARSSRAAHRELSTVMIEGGADSPAVMAALDSQSDLQIMPYKPDARQEVSDNKIRALVVIPRGFDAALAGARTEKVTIGYYENDEKSELAKNRLQKFFDDYRVEVARAALAARGLPASLLEPFTVRAENIAPPAKVGAATFGGWILYMVIIFSFTGAMYPAMDMTAGEKERGTMETILSSPVSRTDLVLGKFLMVLTASVVTTFFSLASMGGSLAWAKRSIMKGAGSALQMNFDPRSVLAVLVLLLPLAVFFAAGLIAVALLAKSYREAQTYVSPLVFIVIAPAIIGTLPGIELNWTTAFVPILNTSLVSKQIFAGTFHWGYIALIFAMTCVYAGLGLAAAVRMFNREEVLFRT